MLTTLDANPQEWMEGDASVIHTVAACHFEDVEHAEHWIKLLVPQDINGKLVKWSGGRRKEKTRQTFIENLTKYENEIDFKINCVSTSEGEMSWFAWAFYYQNNSRIFQKIDEKGRNCLVIPDLSVGDLALPVLRAGYLIWYHHVIRYLVKFKNINGKFLSDNFCADEKGKPLGVGFVNYLLSISGKPQVSLPKNERFSRLDAISDYMCGWVNYTKSDGCPKFYLTSLQKLEDNKSDILESIVYQTNLNIVDENGSDITYKVKQAVANGS